MDIVDSLKLVNINYGSMVKVAFEFLEGIQVKPEIPPDTLMTEDEADREKILGKQLGKLSEEFPFGFLIKQLGLASLLYVFWVSMKAISKRAWLRQVYIIHEGKR